MSFRDIASAPYTATGTAPAPPARRGVTMSDIVSGKGIHNKNVSDARAALNGLSVSAIRGEPKQATWEALSEYAKKNMVGISVNDDSNNSTHVATDDGTVYKQNVVDGSYTKVYPPILGDAAVEAENLSRVRAWGKSSSAIVDAANTDITNTVDVESEPEFQLTKKIGKVYANSRPYSVTHAGPNSVAKKTTYAYAVTLIPSEFGSGSVVTAVRSD